jgi:hypothetical protein
MLASLQRQLCLRLARCALQSQHNLLRRLCLLVENGLGLTTITGLFAIITTLSLREQRRLRDTLLGGPSGGANRAAYLSGLVLCDFVLGVLSAVLALAVGASGLGYVDLWGVWSASILYYLKFISIHSHMPPIGLISQIRSIEGVFPNAQTEFRNNRRWFEGAGVVDWSLDFVVVVVLPSTWIHPLKCPPFSESAKK